MFDDNDEFDMIATQIDLCAANNGCGRERRSSGTFNADAIDEDSFDCFTNRLSDSQLYEEWRKTSDCDNSSSD